MVVDNLGARLLGVRADALYARVLLLFLGLPGVLLAALLTLAVAASDAERRRREEGLLRVRGASTAQILRLQSLEAVVVGTVGVVGGWLLALLAGATLGAYSSPAGESSLVWAAIAGLAGIALAAGAVLVPAWRQTR